MGQVVNVLILRLELLLKLARVLVVATQELSKHIVSAASLAVPDGLQLDLKFVVHKQLLCSVDDRLNVPLRVVVRFHLHQRLLLLQLLGLQQQMKYMPLILQVVL